MNRVLPPILSLISLSVLSSTLHAQSFNIDFGAAGTAQPASSYGAAGLPGFWNAIVAPHTTPSHSSQAFDEALMDLNGMATGVGLHQFGGQAWVNTPDPSFTGADALLMSDALVTHSTGLDTCLYLTGLQNGTYEVISYMYMPTHPEVSHKSLYDTVPGIQTTAGAWTGGHVEGISYTRTIVNITTGFMGPHMGIAAGGDPFIGGAVNGMQLRLIECASQTFCSSTPNSTGAAATISWSGTCSVGLNNLTLAAGPTPNTVGLFFYSQTMANGGLGLPFGNGLRCIGGGTSIYRLPAVAISGGSMSHQVDFGALSPAGQISAGSTWNLQAWFRDPAAGGSQFDLSDGLTLSFDS